MIKEDRPSSYHFNRPKMLTRKLLRLQNLSLKKHSAALEMIKTLLLKSRHQALGLELLSKELKRISQGIMTSKAAAEEESSLNKAVWIGLVFTIVTGMILEVTGMMIGVIDLIGEAVIDLGVVEVIPQAEDLEMIGVGRIEVEMTGMTEAETVSIVAAAQNLKLMIVGMMIEEAGEVTGVEAKEVIQEAGQEGEVIAEEEAKITAVVVVKGGIEMKVVGPKTEMMRVMEVVRGVRTLKEIWIEGVEGMTEVAEDVTEMTEMVGVEIVMTEVIAEGEVETVVEGIGMAGEEVGIEVIDVGVEDVLIVMTTENITGSGSQLSNLTLTWTSLHYRVGQTFRWLLLVTMYLLTLALLPIDPMLLPPLALFLMMMDLSDMIICCMMNPLPMQPLLPSRSPMLSLPTSVYGHSPLITMLHLSQLALCTAKHQRTSPR